MVCAYGLGKRFLTQMGHGISWVALFLASGAGYAITMEHNYFLMATRGSILHGGVLGVPKSF